ncbi:hypothetical protein MPER_00813, partial [Moniliophthora perniciosa FA553]
MSSKEPSVMEKTSVNDVDVLEKVERNGEDDVLAESDYTEEEYRRILRKIDRVLLPLMWVAYGVQQADQTGSHVCIDAAHLLHATLLVIDAGSATG